MPNYLKTFLLAALMLSGLAVDAQQLPNGSRFFQLQDTKLYARELGDANKQMGVLLLSGPTDNFYADSAWFALLQPMLAKQHYTLALDRSGHGFSSYTAGNSYQSFAKQIPQVLAQLPQKSWVIVAYASSNLSLEHVLTKYSKKIRGVVLIDADVLMPESIAQYSGDVQPFIDQKVKVIEQINDGRYHKVLLERLDAEYQHVLSLVPQALKAELDKAFFDAVYQARRPKAKHIGRVEELTMYPSDLRNAAKFEWPKSIPTIVFDTDFEAPWIAEKPELENWRQQGIEYYKKLASLNAKSRYVALEDKEHLMTIANPKPIVKAVQELAAHIN